jgi:hypothetical protein
MPHEFVSCPGLDDKDAFAARIAGDSMMPRTKTTGTAGQCKPEIDDDVWFTPAELGQRWKVTAWMIKRDIRLGKIIAMPRGSTHRIHRAEIERIERPFMAAPEPVVKRRRAWPAVPNHIGI